jgi:hypothetical protein
MTLPHFVASTFIRALDAEEGDSQRDDTVNSHATTVATKGTISQGNETRICTMLKHDSSVLPENAERDPD